MTGQCRRAREALLVTVSLVTVPAAMAQTLPALPTAGTVAAGTASIATPSASRMLIQQGSQNAVINWQSFSIGSGAAVDVRQPSASSILLNKVSGSAASVLDGSLTANGSVWLSNP